MRNKALKQAFRACPQDLETKPSFDFAQDEMLRLGYYYGDNPFPLRIGNIGKGKKSPQPGYGLR